MKIAILYSGDLEEVSLGGIDRYIKSLISFFEDNEITVYGTTVLDKYAIGVPVLKEYGGKKYTFIPISYSKKHPLSLYYFINEFRWITKLGAYDCIYAQRTEYTVPFIFSKNKRKVIQMIHGSSKYSEIGFGKRMAKVHLMLEKIAISIAARTYIILNREEFGVPYYQKKYPKFANKIFYGRNPIDTRIYKPMNRISMRKKLEIPVEDYVVLFSGRVEHNPKRVLLFPEICKKVLEHGIQVKFVVIGDGNDRKQLLSKIESMEMQHSFILPGYIDDPCQIAAYNNAANVTINISMFEGTCTSNLESLACGTPVISTDVGDIHECIYDNCNGIIIENSVNAIIRAYSENIPVNDVYKKYAGNIVVNEFKAEILKL